MKVLLVEDEDPKRINVAQALREIVPSALTFEAYSVTSAMRKLKSEQFDLVLLDMSLPSFDVGPGESGGRPQGFGGIEVLRLMDRLSVKVPVVVVTAYEAFASGEAKITLDALSAQLKKAHPGNFRGLVFYNSAFTSWSDKLRDLVGGLSRP